MKKLFVLAFVVLMVFILLNRQRVFVRDPLATVYRNNEKLAGAEVFINYTNDALVWKEDSPGGFRTLVQNWNKTPGTPLVLRCIHYMACLTDADRATVEPTVPDKPWAVKVSMDNREVIFPAADGAAMRIALR